MRTLILLACLAFPGCGSDDGPVQPPGSCYRSQSLASVCESSKEAPAGYTEAFYCYNDRDQLRFPEGCAAVPYSRGLITCCAPNVVTDNCDPYHCPEK